MLLHPSAFAQRRPSPRVRLRPGRVQVRRAGLREGADLVVGRLAQEAGHGAVGDDEARGAAVHDGREVAGGGERMGAGERTGEGGRMREDR